MATEPPSIIAAFTALIVAIEKQLKDTATLPAIPQNEFKLVEEFLNKRRCEQDLGTLQQLVDRLKGHMGVSPITDLVTVGFGIIIGHSNKLAENQNTFGTRIASLEHASSLGTTEVEATASTCEDALSQVFEGAAVVLSSERTNNGDVISNMQTQRFMAASTPTLFGGEDPRRRRSRPVHAVKTFLAVSDVSGQAQGAYSGSMLEHVTAQASPQQHEDRYATEATYNNGQGVTNNDLDDLYSVRTDGIAASEATRAITVLGKSDTVIAAPPLLEPPARDESTAPPAVRTALSNATVTLEDDASSNIMVMPRDTSSSTSLTQLYNNFGIRPTSGHTTALIAADTGEVDDHIKFGNTAAPRRRPQTRRRPTQPTANHATTHRQAQTLETENSNKTKTRKRTASQIARTEQSPAADFEEPPTGNTGPAKKMPRRQT
ncbi:hypothetical protein BAUCODRAFT_32584 [Baudoinia panamericana UAMH 10762]|uniref:Uncharacterized protein n=1 Tax=Baudoinia panamericana (strain UAMH 10762) TaxID=717646 RepID=M2NGW0_BAUPA|nr:uncharacterized protein BAUCODRAFT_32584 [Baudoinia panamericana UAMH 10762]EMC98534.1 hypothetical protein BAUCODRAFT_32584 [Baudoinia panamericana UAMH 10762]